MPLVTGDVESPGRLLSAEWRWLDPSGRWLAALTGAEYRCPGLGGSAAGHAPAEVPQTLSPRRGPEVYRVSQPRSPTRETSPTPAHEGMVEPRPAPTAGFFVVMTVGDRTVGTPRGHLALVPGHRSGADPAVKGTRAALWFPGRGGAASTLACSRVQGH